MTYNQAGVSLSNFGHVRSFGYDTRREGAFSKTGRVPEAPYPRTAKNVDDATGSFCRLDRIGYDMYYGGNGRYLYQPIPKNGCTKIKSLLLQIENLPVDNNWWHVHQKEYNGFPGTNTLTLEEQIAIFEGRTDTFKFTFIRNPYARMASAYLDKIRKNVAPHIVKKIRTFAEQNGMPVSDEITFSEFVTVVSQQSVAEMDSHFRPQCYEGRFAVVKFDFVGRMETFADDLIYVLERIDAPETAVAQAPARDHETGSTVSIWETVSADARKLFLKAFEIDFDVLQYPRRLPPPSYAK